MEEKNKCPFLRNSFFSDSQQMEINVYFKVILLLVFLALLIVFAFVIKRLETRTRKLERQVHNLRFKQGRPGSNGRNGRPGNNGTLE